MFQETALQLHIKLVVNYLILMERFVEGCIFTNEGCIIKTVTNGFDKTLLCILH